MKTRYQQLLFIVGLTFLVSCTNCSEMSEDDATASSQLQNPIETSDSISGTTPIPIPERPSSEIPSIATPTAPTESSVASCEDGIWEGDVRTESDVIAARDCIEITGGIWIVENTSALTEIEFPVLERVYGEIRLNAISNLVSITMPVLAAFEDNVDISFNNALRTIVMPQVTTAVGIRILIEDNAVLTMLDFSDLTMMEAGTLAILANAALSNFDLPALTKIQSIYIIGNTSLSNFNLPALTTLENSGLAPSGSDGNFNIERNHALIEINMPVLTTVGAHFLIASNDALTSITMPVFMSTERGDVSILGNAALMRVTMPVLTTVGEDLFLVDNNALTSFILPEITTVGESLSIFANAALITVELPRLATVTTDEVHIDNVALDSCDLGDYTDQCP